MNISMKEFNDHQKEEIEVGIQEGLDVSIYAKPEFDGFQMSAIKDGLREGLDVSIYAKPEFGSDRMWYIRDGLREGIDASIYAKPEFDVEQMLIIRDGLRDDVDVSAYAKPKIPWKEMWQKKLEVQGHKLSKKEKKLYVSNQSKFDYLQMYFIAEGIKKGLDTTLYVRPGLKWDEILYINDYGNLSEAYKKKKGLLPKVHNFINRKSLSDIRKEIETAKAKIHKPNYKDSNINKEKEGFFSKAVNLIKNNDHRKSLSEMRKDISNRKNESYSKEKHKASMEKGSSMER